MTTPPTIILLHDAFHQASHYIDFDAALQDAGLSEVRIPQLPSCSRNPAPTENAFEEDVKVAKKTILSCLRSGRDVMVLAHGYGGKVVSDALEGIPVDRKRENAKVLGVVFVAGVVCEEEEDGTEQGGSFVKGEVCRLTSPHYDPLTRAAGSEFDGHGPSEFSL
ncbi:hypothetical protein EJ03DRAFT_330776 [Teratosphaeria nubilosa]|uniref:AB hydrolase-1 domain-containing protein n=1 Tax=Teratosphaeria nubilosa TaxID=161662 RepID=A0A6G1KZA2_9PEZI|nr:hypothetical protein EJ03DRAFT_330776 [Teratosphaeria nubilosa]